MIAYTAAMCPAPPTHSTLRAPFAQMTCLADQWSADICLDLCMHHLAQTSAEQLTVADVSSLLSAMPVGIALHRGYPAVQQACQEQLLLLFGDVQEVVIRPLLLHNFCSLLYEAVAVWASSDDLEVDSENSVVLLLTRWCSHNHRAAAEAGGAKAEEAKDKQAQALAGLLRLGHLSRCGSAECSCNGQAALQGQPRRFPVCLAPLSQVLQSCVLPQLQWLSSVLPQLVQYANNPDPSPDLPVAWFKPARSNTPGSCAPLHGRSP